MRYPKRGDHVRVTGEWRGQVYDLTGVVLKEGRMVRSGAVLGQVLASGGRVGRRDVTNKIVWVPWSTQYVHFDILG
jgi:hypothetical protein